MLIRLADRKGSLKGDLSILQDRALLWLIDNELSESGKLEGERMKYTLLASNPQLYDQLYSDQDEGIPADEDIEWMVPESVEEVEEILNFLNSTQIGSEQGS